MVSAKFGAKLLYAGVKLLDYNINTERASPRGRLKTRCEVKTL